MAKARAAKSPKPEEIAPEEESQEIPEEPTSFRVGKVSKAEAVRRAVSAGKDSPADGVAYVMEHFGIEMDNKTFSLNKAQAKSRSAKKTPKPEPRVDTPKKTPKPSTEMLGAIIPPGLFDDLKKLKEMKEKYGPEFEKLLNIM